MAVRTIQVTPKDLETAASSIEGLAKDYKSQYDALYNATDALAAEWKGEDNQAYVDRIAGFKDDLKRMYDLMNAYAEFLRTSAKAYRDTQDAVVAAAKKLAN